MDKLKCEEKLLALIMATSDAIYLMSPDWKTMSILYERGVPEKNLKHDQQWLDRYIHPQDHALVLDAINEFIKEKKGFELEHRVLAADGKIGWTLSRAIPLFDDSGNIEEWLCAASDITKRKKIEKLLAFQAYLLDNVYDAVIATDMDFRITYWNKAAERMYGWSEEEALGKGIDALFNTEYIFMDQDQAARRLMQEKSADVEIIHTCKDGSRIHVQSKVSIVLDNNKMPIGTVGVLRDITDRKHFEDVLRESEGKRRSLDRKFG